MRKANIFVRDGNQLSFEQIGFVDRHQSKRIGCECAPQQSGEMFGSSMQKAGRKKKSEGDVHCRDNDIQLEMKGAEDLLSDSQLSLHRASAAVRFRVCATRAREREESRSR